MAKGKSGSVGGNSGKSGSTSNSRAGSPGRGRPPNGFTGGNWPSTVSGAVSGGNRGSSPSKG